MTGRHKERRNDVPTRKTLAEMLAAPIQSARNDSVTASRVANYGFVLVNFVEISAALKLGASYHHIWSAYRANGVTAMTFQTFVRNVRKRERAEASAPQLTPPPGTANPIASPHRSPVAALGVAPFYGDNARLVTAKTGNNIAPDISATNPDGPWTRDECLDSRGDLIDPITKERLGDDWRFDEAIGRPRELTKPEKRERNRARTVNFKQGTGDGFRKPIFNDFQTRAQILGLEKK